MCVLACNKKSEGVSKKKEYNFSIIYDYIHLTEREDKYRSMCSYDSLYFFIESSFDNDTIQIKARKNELIRIVNTDYAIGLAEVIPIGGIEGINEIYFAVNNSPKISFELIDKKMNIIGVSKKGKNIELRFYKRVPMYE